MKKTLMILGVLAALSMVFVGCDQPTTTEDATGGSSSTPTTQATTTDADKTDTATPAADADDQPPAADADAGDDNTATAGSNGATLVSIFSGSTVLEWSGDDAVVIDHSKFEAGFKGIKVTFTATGGSFKVAVCDPWEELAPASAEGDGGLSADDSDGKTIGLATKENGAITVTFSSADATKIIGEEKEGAWGGIKIFGDNTITVSKVELVK